MMISSVRCCPISLITMITDEPLIREPLTKLSLPFFSLYLCMDWLSIRRVKQGLSAVQRACLRLGRGEERKGGRRRGKEERGEKRRKEERKRGEKRRKEERKRGRRRWEKKKKRIRKEIKNMRKEREKRGERRR